MRVLLAIFLCLPAAAQEARKEQGGAAVAASAERLTGSVEVGARWSIRPGGNQDVYRSVVNLGEGVKLFGLDLSLTDPSRRLFDKLNVRGSGWGGDPYNTARVDAERKGGYRFTLDYRNIAFFNALPSFADPTASRGFLFSQKTYDVERKMLDAQLELVPNRRVVPYLAYSRGWGSGKGVTDFVADFNEYAVANRVADRSDSVLGGVRIDSGQFHVTLEQGFSAFRDDEQLYHANKHLGNVTTPFFGQRLSLSSLSQTRGSRGDNYFSKALFTARPASWVDLHGQLLYSRPRSQTKYAQYNSGNFFSLADFVLFTSQQNLLNSQSRQPHTSGSFSIELRPVRRVRVFESVMSDRWHVPDVLPIGTYTLFSGSTPIAGGSIDAPRGRVQYTYHRQEVNVLVDVTSWLALRGGHRYVWGDSTHRAPVLGETVLNETGELSMQVGLAGLTLRPAENLSLSLDCETASADRNYFRTSLQDYRKLRARARYRVLQSLSLNANFSLLRNENPSTASRYEFLSRDNSISAYWSPWGGKWINLLGEYTRTTLTSDISYFIPQQLTRAQSFYSENAHIGTGMLDVSFPELMKSSPKLSVGGSLFRSTGSRPTEYYQPIAKFLFPVYRGAQWMSEWRWYRFAESRYQYEGFRTHHFVTGLRLTL
jgi:hypothetical protein